MGNRVLLQTLLLPVSTLEHLDNITKFVRQHALSVFVGCVAALLPSFGFIPPVEGWSETVLLFLFGLSAGEVLFFYIAPGVRKLWRILRGYVWTRKRITELKDIDRCEVAALRQAMGWPVPNGTPHFDTPVWEPIFAHLKRKDILAEYGHSTWTQARYSVSLQPGVEEYLSDHPELVDYYLCAGVTEGALSECSNHTEYAQDG